jgi:hypothetical protein
VRVGLDLDGTIVLYDEIFHAQAVAQLDMPAVVPARKTEIRAWCRDERGEQGWIELQSVVYGPLMERAAPAPSVREFIEGCRDAGIDLSVISHRTRLSAARTPVDLHGAARAWLERSGLFELGLDPSNVHLEVTREAKIARIRAELCALFVDDLPEVFAEPSFPQTVERWLYEPGARRERRGGIEVFGAWPEALERAQALQGANPG